MTGQRMCDGRKAACAVVGKVTLTISPLGPPALTRTCASGKRWCLSSTLRTNRAEASQRNSGLKILPTDGRLVRV